MTTLVPLLAMITSSGPEGIEALPFGPGEEAVFQMKTLGLRAGTAQFDIGAATEVNGVSVWPIVMVARSEGLAETMFPVRERFVSFWDPVARLPVQADLTASEGSRKRTLSMKFHRGDPPHADVHIAEVGKEPESLSVDMDPGAQDFQAAVYALRTRPLKVGDYEDLAVVAGKRVWTMTASVLEQVEIDVPAGHFAAVRLEVTEGFGGRLKSNRNIVGYFSDDARHLPLRFEADLSLGTMVAELIRFSPSHVR